MNEQTGYKGYRHTKPLLACDADPTLYRHWARLVIAGVAGQSQKAVAASVTVLCLRRGM